MSISYEATGSGAEMVMKRLFCHAAPPPGERMGRLEVCGSDMILKFVHSLVIQTVLFKQPGTPRLDFRF